MLLEPIMKVTVTVPEEYMGDVIGDLQHPPRSDPGLWKPAPAREQIDASVPLAEMFGYATDLRSRTQGRGQLHDGALATIVEMPKSIAGQDHR